MKTSSRLKLNTWLLPALTGIALLADLFTAYRGWRVIFVGLGLALLISYVWARALAQGLDLTREMRFGWAQVGDRLVERFTLFNHGWAPAVWVEVRDASTMPDYNVSRGTGFPGHNSIRWHTEAQCKQRGLFMLGPTRLETGDPLGVFSVTLEYPATLPLLVLPPIVPLPAIEVGQGGRSGEGRPRANAVERTVSAASVREYVPGDSRRWIHWRTSARQDNFYVRMFDGTPAGDWWILLDMDRHVQLGIGQNATDEYGVILAASLADRGVRMGRPVGLAAYGDRLVWLPPASGEGQRWEILRALALVNQGDHPLAEMLQRVRPALGQHTSVIIVTPSVNTQWVESLIPLLRRGAVPTVLMLGRESFGGAGNTARIETALRNLGVASYRITRDLLDVPESRPGQQGNLEWRVSGTGKAVLSQRMTQAPWKVLS